MDNAYIEKQIKEKFWKLNKRLSTEEKKNFHFKSVENFIFHIFKEKSNKNSKKKIYEINLKRNKELLIKYLSLIESEGVNNLESKSLYKEYIEPVGEFMNRNYGFSFAGGIFLYFHFLIYITIGIFIDTIFWFILKEPILIIGFFTVILFTYSIIKIYIKAKKGKLYGPNF